MDTRAGLRFLVVFTIFLTMFNCDYGLSELSNVDGDSELHDPLRENVFPLAIADLDNSSEKQSQIKVLGADDDITSAETLELIETILCCYINPILFLVGCPGNVLCTIVFGRRGCKERVHLCMIVLAILDCLTITTWFLMNIVAFFDFKGEERKYMQWSFLKWFRGPHHGFMFSSGCMVALMSVERCISVTLPHKAAYSLTTMTMTSIILVINVIVQVMCMSFTVNVTVTWVDGTTQLPHTEFYKNNKQLVDWTQDFVVMFLLPLFTMVVVSVATTKTVLVLKRAGKWQTSVNKSAIRKRTPKVTLIRMLVTVSIIYVVIHVPSLCISIASLQMKETFRIGGKYHNTYMAFHMGYWTLGSINSAVNFLVYALRSSRFRYDCVHLLPTCMQARAMKAFGIEMSQISHIENSTSTQRRSIFRKITRALSIHYPHMTLGTSFSHSKSESLTNVEAMRSGSQLSVRKHKSVAFVNIQDGISHDVPVEHTDDRRINIRDGTISHDLDSEADQTTQGSTLSTETTSSPEEDTDSRPYYLGLQHFYVKSSIRAWRNSILRLQEKAATDNAPTVMAGNIGSPLFLVEQDIGVLDYIPMWQLKRTTSSSVEPDLHQLAGRIPKKTSVLVHSKASAASTDSMTDPPAFDEVVDRTRKRPIIGITGEEKQIVVDKTRTPNNYNKASADSSDFMTDPPAQNDVEVVSNTKGINDVVPSKEKQIAVDETQKNYSKASADSSDSMTDPPAQNDVKIVSVDKTCTPNNYNKASADISDFITAQNDVEVVPNTTQRTKGINDVVPSEEKQIAVDETQKNYSKASTNSSDSMTDSLLKTMST